MMLENAENSVHSFSFLLSIPLPLSLSLLLNVSVGSPVMALCLQHGSGFGRPITESIFYRQESHFSFAVHVCFRVRIVVFVCPNEPCVFVHECACTQKPVYPLCVCVCMYAHKCCAISFLLNDFPSAESILPVGVRWLGKECS